MLVLQLTESQKVILTIPPSTTEQRVEVTMVQVRGKFSARIGFDAPKEIKILREELQWLIDNAPKRNQD